MSYRKSHVKGKIQGIKPKIPVYKRLGFWILISCIILTAIIAYFALFFPGVQIKAINISGTSKADKQSLESLVSKAVTHKFLSLGKWSLQSKSIFLADSRAIEKDILRQFPVVAAAKADKKFFSSVIVQITEKTAVAIFCRAEDCYLVDGSGIAFERPDGSNLVIVRQNDESIFGDNLLGKKVLEKNAVAVLEKVQKNLRDKFQISLSSANVAGALRLNASTSEGWRIYFDLDSGPDQQVIKLNTLLSGEISESERSKLYYIDLRPQDRAIICDNSVCGN